MKQVLVAGAGKIGSFIAQLLVHSGDYQVVLIDSDQSNLSAVAKHPALVTTLLDVTDHAQLSTLQQQRQSQAVISCLPYFCNVSLAEFAATKGMHYFDLTEDVGVSQRIEELASTQSEAFVCRCGVAPGFINIVAHHLMQQFSTLDTVKLRAGCLPQNVSNSLKYALAWSIDGLINEYGNTCYGISESEPVALQPLHDLEKITLDGVQFEAFNTSGGVGALLDMYQGKVKNLNYKTLRYPGHGEKMRFLMQDLGLNEAREQLKALLLKALPKTNQDIMVVFVSVSGEKEGQFIEKNRLNTIMPETRFDQHWSAIQVATASSAAAVIDIILQNPNNYQGFVLQETLPLENILKNRFGQVFAA